MRRRSGATRGDGWVRRSTVTPSTRVRVRSRALRPLRSRSAERLVLVAIALLAGAPLESAASSDAAAGPVAWRWRRVLSVSGEQGVSALAWDPALERLAVGDARGFSLGDSSPPPPRQRDGRSARGALARGGAADAGGVVRAGLSQEFDSVHTTHFEWRRWPLTAGVQDLHFAPDGALWIATAGGLWRLDPQADHLRDRSPAAGERGRCVHRVRSVAAPGVASVIVVAAAEAGAFVLGAGGRWLRLGDGLPEQAFAALGLRLLGEVTGGRPGSRGHAALLEVWLLTGARLWRALVRVQPDGVRIESARQEPIPGRPSAEAPIEISSGLSGVALGVLFPSALARLFPTAAGGRRWEVGYPLLPAAASARRLERAGGLFWLSTDRGLLRAQSFFGRWQRVRGGPASTPVSALVGDAERVYAASGPAVFEGREISTPAKLAPRPSGWAPSNSPLPTLRQVHARALLWAGLEPERSDRRLRGLHRRGWLPVLSLRAAAGYDREKSEDHDQSFSYGELHRLHDRGSARSRDFDATLTLSWDLGDLAYSPDEVDLSREERQVVTLRDDLLDEVTRLYFDRQRALRALAAFADRRDPEAVALALRTAELLAGLDARTGGWFSEQSAREAQPSEAPRAAQEEKSGAQRGP